MPWSFAVEALGLALELPFCQRCVFQSFRENPVMLCQAINSWQIAIYSYSEEFSNENLCGVLERQQLPVLDRPGIVCFRLRLQGCCQKDFVMPISHYLVSIWSTGVGIPVFLMSPLSFAPRQARRGTMILTEGLKSDGEADLLGCRVRKGLAAHGD